MRVDMSEEQWDAVEAGEVESPHGTVFRRGTTRSKRKDVDSLVKAGAPVLTYWPGGLPEKTRVIWQDGADALTAWQEARPSLTAEQPRPPARGAVATAGLWRSDGDEELVVLTWHH